MRWCEENTLHFVRIYLSKECLWNPNHDWYKMKFRREAAYYNIIEKFRNITGKCMTIPEVKIKIKNLRSTYKQQVQKILRKSGPDSIYEPSLAWFHEMDQCLKYVPNSRTTLSDEYIQDSQDLDSMQVVWADTSFADECSDPLIPHSYSDNEYESAIPEESALYVTIEDSPEQCNEQRTKRKKKKMAPYFIRSQSENMAQEDEFDIYGKHIAMQLRQLDLQKALKVQLEIQNLVNEARISAPED